MQMSRAKFHPAGATMLQVIRETFFLSVNQSCVYQFLQEEIEDEREKHADRQRGGDAVCHRCG
jgi:hypothetical protein